MLAAALNNVVGGWGIDGVTTFQRGFPLIFRNGQAKRRYFCSGWLSSKPFCRVAANCLRQRDGSAQRLV